MPSDYRIILATRVVSDLQGIFDHIAAESPQNAAKVVNRVLTALEGLKAFPHRTVVVKQPLRLKNPIRSLPVQSWVIFFTVSDDQKVVRVLRVRHGSRRRPRRFDK
jgi:toxin ParE1/3/4